MAGGGLDENLRPDAVSVAFDSLGSNREPIPAIPAVVPEQGWFIVLIRYENIHITVVVKIRKGGAAAYSVLELPHPDQVRDVHESLALDVAEQIIRLGVGVGRITLLQPLIGVAVGNEKVQPAIVVKIDELRAPTAVIEPNLEETEAGRLVKELVVPSFS